MAHYDVHRIEPVDQMDDDHFALGDLTPETRIASFGGYCEELMMMAKVAREIDDLDEDTVLVIRFVGD